MRSTIKQTHQNMTLRQLTPVLEKKAKVEINENPKTVSSDIAALRGWLKMQPHLVNVDPNQWLLAYLRGCKFSLERTKEKLDMTYTLRTIVPEIFADRDPMSLKLQEVLKLGIFLPLRKCASPDGPRVSIIRLGVFDPSRFHLYDVIKVAYMVTEILMLEDDNFGVAGEEVIVDLKHVGMSLISQWTPTLANKVVMSFEKGLPVRQKGNHILHTPTGFEAAYKIFRMFIGEKMKKRIQVHNQNYTEMYKSIPKTILPTEYGGKDGSLHELIDHWKLKVESYRDWYLQQSQQKSVESKRPGKPLSSSELFGIDGSFRKLEVD